MAYNSLNSERSNQDKLLQAQREAKKAKKQQMIALSIVVSVLLAIAAFVLGIIFFQSARPWIISIGVCVVYVVFWNYIRFQSDADYVPWYMFTNICLCIACIPLYCVSSVTRAYAFGFALAIFVSAIGLLIQCWGNMSVQTTTEYDRYARSYVGGIPTFGRSYQVNTYIFKHGGREYLSGFYFTLIGGILFSISLGLIFTGLARILVIGCGIAIIYVIMTALSQKLYYDYHVGNNFITFDVLMGLTGIGFMIASYNLTILAICLFAAVVLSSFILTVTRGESDSWGWGVAGGVVLAGIAVLVLLFSHTPVTDGFVIKNGELLSYNGTEEVVVIPDEVTKIHESAFKYKNPKNNMKEVVIHGGVEIIGVNAFKECLALTTVTIEDGVTQIKDSAFYGCTKLESVTVPGSVTSIGASAFSGCYGLSSVTLEDGVVSIGAYAFHNCTKLSEIDIPESINYFGDSAFDWCTSLKEIYIPKNFTSFGEKVFARKNAKIIIKYAGTQEEWQDIVSYSREKWSKDANCEIVYMSKPITD